MSLKRGLDNSLEASFDIAKKTMKARAISFYHAFSKLPTERFRAVTAVYAFCRHADDAVDRIKQVHDRERATEELNLLERRVRKLYGYQSNQPHSTSDALLAEPAAVLGEPLWWPAFRHTVSSFGIPLDSALKQLKGQRMDLDFTDIQTLDELTDYARLVAGSVGTMLLPLLTEEAGNSRDLTFAVFCEDLGIAMQLTNILRDVGEDLRTRGRLYLPADLLAKYGVDRGLLQDLSTLADNRGISSAKSIPQNFIDLWESLAGIAEGYYQGYQGWIKRFHPDCRFPLVASVLNYRGIADAVRAADYNCLTRRCYTSSAARARFLLEARRLTQA